MIEYDRFRMTCKVCDLMIDQTPSTGLV